MPLLGQHTHRATRVLWKGSEARRAYDDDLGRAQIRDLYVMRVIVKRLLEKVLRSSRQASETGMPDLLAPYRDVIERTRVPILAGQVLPDPPIGDDQSQLGGQPWWPADLEMPIGQSGERLHLLAQINFAELPQMTPMPTAGLLQFFIGDDDLYGANVDDPRSSVRRLCGHGGRQSQRAWPTYRVGSSTTKRRRETVI